MLLLHVNYVDPFTFWILNGTNAYTGLENSILKLYREKKKSTYCSLPKKWRNG